MYAFILRIGLIAALIALSTDAYASESLGFDSPALEAQSSTIRDGALQADAVFVGRIVEVGPAPQVESGRILASQAVVYEVLEVLKGKLEAGNITVRHLVKPDDPFSSQLVKGKELLVFAQQRGNEYWAAGSVAGAIPASQANVGAVKEILQKG